MTQAKTRPPGFVVMCSHPDKVPETLERALRDVDGGQSVLLNIACRAGGRN